MRSPLTMSTRCFVSVLQEIATFCSLTYPVTFPLLKKADVNGDNTTPVYQYLKKEAPGILGLTSIKWNFTSKLHARRSFARRRALTFHSLVTEFIISREGKVVKRYSPTTTPESIDADIAKLLQGGSSVPPSPEVPQEAGGKSSL